MEWISIEDKLPPLIASHGSLARNSGFLHVLRSSGEDVAVLFENGRWLDRHLDPIDDVTHWRESELDWYEVLEERP